ncbi:MAG: hypothetical protein OEU97_00775 [Dehalococcoidia bacterium]|nr:hypothetical protein [Dehalococcoidia bacterium]
MTTKRMVIITIAALLLVVIVFFLVLYVDYTRTISPRDIKIGKLTESVKSIKLDYDIKSVTVKYYRYGAIVMSLYFRDMLSIGTERDIFLDCARAITDPETLTLFKEKYLDRLDITSEIYDLNRESYDSDGYPYFDTVICLFFFNSEDNLAHRFESMGGKGNENYDHWYCENIITGEGYSLTLSESSS